MQTIRKQPDNKVYWVVGSGKVFRRLNEHNDLPKTILQVRETAFRDRKTWPEVAEADIPEWVKEVVK